MRTTQDEAIRRSNILWTVKERLEGEARAEGWWAMCDIKKAHEAKDEEMGHFYTFFAASKARDAATFARMALEALEQIEYLRTVK